MNERIKNYSLIGVTEKPESEHVKTLRKILIPARSALTLKLYRKGRAAAIFSSVRIVLIKRNILYKTEAF